MDPPCHSINSFGHCVDPADLPHRPWFTGLGSPVNAQEFNSESTTAGSRIYHTWFRLGPGEGIQEVTIEGALRFSPDETKIEWIDDKAYLSIVLSLQLHITGHYLDALINALRRLCIFITAGQDH